MLVAHLQTPPPPHGYSVHELRVQTLDGQGQRLTHLLAKSSCSLNNLVPLLEQILMMGTNRWHRNPHNLCLHKLSPPYAFPGTSLFLIFQSCSSQASDQLAKSFFTSHASVYIRTSSKVDGWPGALCPKPCPSGTLPFSPVFSFLFVLAWQQYLPYGTHALNSSPSSQGQAFSSLSAGHSDPSWGQRGELRERRLCNSDGWPESPCHLVTQLNFPLQPSLCLILDVNPSIVWRIVPRPAHLMNWWIWHYPAHDGQSCHMAIWSVPTWVQ